MSKSRSKNIDTEILEFCKEKKSITEIQRYFSLSRRTIRYKISLLLKDGLLYKIPNLYDLRTYYVKTSQVEPEEDLFNLLINSEIQESIF